MAEHDGGFARRDVMLGAVACCFAAPTVAFADDASDLPQKGDKLVFNEGDNDGKPIMPDAVTPAAGVVLAIPLDASGAKKENSRFSKVLMVRMKPEDITEEYRPNTVDGIVAYSAVCTHQGCTINAYNQDTKVLECFCHHSQFSPGDGGAVAHGPARKRLPMLPIAKGPDGGLIAAGEFTAKPGPGPA